MKHSLPPLCDVVVVAFPQHADNIILQDSVSECGTRADPIRMQAGDMPCMKQIKMLWGFITTFVVVVPFCFAKG